MLCVIFVLFFASPYVTPAAVKDGSNLCGVNEFICDDGSCVSLDLLCRGTYACPDRSDDKFCSLYANQISFVEPVANRTKRQSDCRIDQWQCRDGTCIDFDGKCDGVVNCPDGSDETHALCRNSVCQRNWFRCAYGACVDGTARCNRKKECADNSDELHPACYGKTYDAESQFKCESGEVLSAGLRCNGKKDCIDGSDETIQACAAEICPSVVFQCAYGACVDQGANCNGKRECADGSDESDELCNRISQEIKPTPRPKPTPVPTPTPNPSSVGSSSGLCVLPPYPNNGKYIVGGIANAAPGQRFDSFNVNVTCNPGYGVKGKSSVYCVYGDWSGEVPQCVQFCRLRNDPSVKYMCIERQGTAKLTRECKEYEPDGIVVSPTCNAPNYYYARGVLRNMYCVEGSWDYVARCDPECGKVTPFGSPQIINGIPAKRGELPWHVGIYRKRKNQYEQICGGSLVSTVTVISAAHCFWSDTEKVLPARNYAVAAGKLYRDWDDPRDEDAQKSDVAQITVPDLFSGTAANFQDDIAVVILATVIEYKTFIRPVCLDFNVNFERRHLTAPSTGKVAGWGLKNEEGDPSEILRVVDLPYIDPQTCITHSPFTFREYITSDKICAGFRNGTAVCHGDSGGGLTFLGTGIDSEERYFLRGIVSTAPETEKKCNAYAYTTFTRVIKHEDFINSNIK